jgi:hypothetical protein
MLTVAALAGTAAALLALARALGRRGQGQVARAFGIAGLGAALLAADDALAAHETIGHNLPVLARLPIVDHPDDLLVALYGLVALGFAWRHRALARGTPVLPWAVAAGSGALAVVHDLLPLHLGAVEEGSEVAAALALLAGVTAVALAHLRAPATAAADAGDRPWLLAHQPPPSVRGE